MVFKCIVGDCPNTIDIDSELALPDFRYVCSGRMAYGDDKLSHDKAQQVRAVKKIQDKSKDDNDRENCFQNIQFDKDLLSGARPEGTNHIPNPKSRVASADTIDDRVPRRDKYKIEPGE